jgi:Flp pilus assembly protein TadD
MKRILAGTVALCALWAPALLAQDTPAARDSAGVQPSDVATEVARAHALRQEGKLTEAASNLAQIMLVAPDDARVVGEYGKVMAEEHRAQDALAFLKRAVELQQNDWSLYSALGVAYDENNDPKDAASAYQRALALKPGEPVVLNNYGMSRMLAGDYAAAQMMFAQAQRSGDPRIVNNAAMLAEIEARQPQHQAAARSVVNVPVTSVPARIAATPLPEPRSAATATGAPHAMTAMTALENNPRVVMQAVPKDPLAGPVKPRVAPHRVATRKKPASATPALRTAADAH